MEDYRKNLKPFVKWAGGKTQVLDVINILKPDEINTFIEPFVGGGAVFFNIAHPKAIINDINQDLMIIYEVIKKDHKQLKNLLNRWNSIGDLKDFYEKLKIIKQKEELDSIHLAARMIFLNKYGFNGLYRVNSQGQFNVPFGKKNKVNLFDVNNINNISKYLNEHEITILNQDYQNILEYIKPGDFLFVDPPYYFENNKGFNAYDSSKFGINEQEKLYNFLILAEKKGAKWILTNNDSDFIRKLYKNYNIFSKKTNRFINSNPEKRLNSAQEVFIFNYKITEEAKWNLNFINFLDTFIGTNITLDKYVDWDKIENKICENEYDISIFNFLRSKNELILKEKLSQYWDKHYNSFEKLYILLAARESNSFLHNRENRFFKNLNFNTPEDIIDFLKTSGLIKLFIANHKVYEVNFLNYILGIEVGMDSNARKNRFGKIMENNIEQILIDSNIKFEKKSNLSIMKKSFDFKFTKNNKIYYLECNFFNSGGSKINETTKSYIKLNNDMEKANLNFIWVTDGHGWKTAQSSLKSAYFNIKNLFSIELFKQWINQN